MRQVFELRSILGALIWVALIAGGILLARNVMDQSPDSVHKLAQYVGRQRRTISLESQYNLALRVGDPVYLADSVEVSPIGYVSHITLAKDGYYASEVDVSMYGSSPAISEDDHFEFHFAPDSTEWLIRTMFTPAKKDQIRILIEDALKDNQADIVNAFQPVIKKAFVEAQNQIRTDLTKAIASRQEELDKIGDRYREELLKQEFVPLFQDELWPIIQTESEPLVNEVAQEIWKEVSVFSFGWRYAYDRLPLPEKNLTERKFNTFVKEKAQPIIESHLDDFLELQKTITARITQNQAFRDTVKKSFRKVSTDPEIQQLLADVFREVIVDNKQLHESLKQQFQSPEAQQAMDFANSRLDPTIREIGVALFGTPREGITPEFAKVLRRRILHKDAKWLTLHLKDAEQNRELDRNAPFPKSLPVLLSDEDTNIPIAIKED